MESSSSVEEHMNVVREKGQLTLIAESHATIMLIKSAVLDAIQLNSNTVFSGVQIL